MSLYDKLQKEPPQTSKANLRGVDYTPIGDESNRPEFKPSDDLVNNEDAIKKGRGGYELGAGPSDYKGTTNTPNFKYSSITRK